MFLTNETRTFHYPTRGHDWLGGRRTGELSRRRPAKPPPPRHPFLSSLSAIIWLAKLHCLAAEMYELPKA